MRYPLVLLAVLTLVLGACQEKPLCCEPAPCPTCWQQYGSPYANVPNTENILLYEMNLWNQTSEGTLAAAEAHLDSLVDLHINTVWLMPIFPQGTVNSVGSPYCVKDYQGVSAHYGSLQDIRDFVALAHSKGIAVILDWIANHTAWDHPWVAEHPEWYTQDTNGTILHPPGTNWQDVADLNFEVDSMRLAMISALKYWVLEVNVDGFRFDAADMVPDDFWAQALDSLTAIPDRKLILLAEGGNTSHYASGFHLTYGWTFYSRLKDVFVTGSSAGMLASAHNQEYAGWPACTQRVRFATNHDESAWDATPFTLFGGRSAATAAHVCATFMGGIPMVYTGQEVGETGTSSFFQKDPVTWGLHPGMKQTFQDLFGVYAASEPAQTGSLKSFSHPDIVCFKRTAGVENLLVFVNTRNQTVTMNLATELKNTTWTNAQTGASTSLETSLTLAPYQYLLLE